MVLTRLRSGAGKRVNYRALAGMKPKRTYRRRRGVNTTKVKRTLGIPDRMITKLEYRVGKQINSSFGATAIVDYRLNSIYDPEIALGGHQPMWRDQYDALYNKYRVFRCKYEFKICAINSNGTPLRVVTLSSAQQPSSLPSTITTAWEQNRTGNRLIPSGSDKITTMRGNISLPYLQGQTSVAFKGDDDNASGMGGDPVNWAVLRFLAESANSSAETVQYSIDVKLTYFVEFFDRKTPSPS